MKTGKPLSPEDIQRWANQAWAPEQDAAAPRCVDEEMANGTAKRCVTNAPRVDELLTAGLIAENLVLTWDGKTSTLPDEAFCFVAWGRLLECGVMGAGGIWDSYFARDGTPIFKRTMHAEHGQRDIAGAAYRKAVPWDQKLIDDVVDLAERTATSFGADFIRIDIFPNGGKPLVAEVSIVSGWLGSNNLEWANVDAWLIEYFRDRWLEGYGERYGRYR